VNLPRIPRERLVHYLAIARVILAGTSLLIQIFLAPVQSALVTLVILLYAVSSVFFLRYHGFIKGVYRLLVLCLDTVFLLLLAKFGIPETLWLAPMFYLYLLTCGVVMYGPREVAAVAAACVLFFATAHPGEKYVLREVVLVGGAFACAYSLQKRRLEAKVEELREEGERLREAAEVAREGEQQRIAADFHDGPLQEMISFQMRLEILKKLLQRNLGKGLEELDQLQDLAKTQVREMRTFVRNMRPLDVDGASLTAAARRLVDDFQKESGIAVTFVGGDRPLSAAPETCTDVLQMIREALNNVRKHARATRVAVAIEKVGKILEVSVDDNGVGFHFSGQYSLDELELLRLGPVSLKRRARSLGADMSLDSRPGRGTGLKIKVPI
jgi:signal transduction histidine kinase